MIDESATPFFVCYGIVCAALGIFYIRNKSSEGTVITTKEFQLFQTSFIGGYSAIILCELVASATFYHTFLNLDLDLTQIAKLYMATTFASTLTSIVMEMIDIGARKDKCVLSALLYSVSMFSVLFGGHYEMLLLGRIVYGAASALQHTSFEGYAVHQHSSQGFPEDWLSHTFTLLTHTMALVAALTGVVGAIGASAGRLGCIAFCCVCFAITAFYLLVAWEKDLNNPRFMLSGFLYNMNQSVNAVRSNKQLFFLLSLSSLYETSITVFMFYWAPWLGSVMVQEDQANAVPYELLFSTLVAASMLGNYFFQLAISSQLLTLEGLFTWVLIGTSVAYGLGATLQTATFILPLALMIQLCMGIYWPCIGHYRGRMVLPELRSTTLILPKLVVLVASVLILSSFSHSPLLVLMTCAGLTGCAAYIQQVHLDKNLGVEDDDDLDEEL